MSEDQWNHPVKMGGQVGYAMKVVDTMTKEVVPYDFVKKYLDIGFQKNTRKRRQSLERRALHAKDCGDGGSICPQGFDDVEL